MIEEAQAIPVGSAERLTLRELVEHYERDLILTALVASGGNQRLAAEALGVLQSTLSEKLKRLNLYAPLKPGTVLRKNGHAASASSLNGGGALASPATPQKEKK